ncbi:MbnP family protein [Lewinella sp. JB7]|uniref:MbnP family protein n=1 Tax=Lewinella sp. JB7 TaxID=2962887 RepID=UPI0020C9DC1D|nr:MbnP family protein [Lewinella sp. JB7]MCP9236466.1 hypothetical protein [Lewinella sp. JB7]
MRPILICCYLAVCLTSCYEASTGCLDPDADNYDLLADEGCTDCCTYPTLSVRSTVVWQDTAVVAGQTYRDGAGHDFQLIRFRYYLGDLRLESAAADLPDPSRSVTLLEVLDGDTSQVTVNGNYLLATTASVTTTGVGTVNTGVNPLTSLSGSYGLPDRYRNVIPASAPSGDALRTQAGRLNFRDGRGYVQARLEYTLPTQADTLSVSSFGSTPFEIDFGGGIVRVRGADIRLDMYADLHALLGTIDLTSDSATIANGLGRTTEFLSVVGITQ